MLQEIRERAQGWVAWFIVILISVPFALWGISSYIDGGSTLNVASVNGQDISEREFENGFRQFRQRIRDQLGSNYRPELIDDGLLREEFLQSLIKERLLVQATSSMGLSTADALVRSYIDSIPAFSAGGQFNNEVYERALRSQGFTPVGFEAQVRQSLVTEQLSRGVSGTEFTTDTELRDLVRLQMQRRNASYVTFPATKYESSVEIADADVQRYYQAEQATFMAPERIKVDYIELNIDNLSTTLKSDEESLLGYYEQHKSEYVTAERRRASHILFATGEGGTGDAEALAQAEKALERIRGGEEFATVAKALSQDPGSADAGGDLGYFDRGVMDTAFEDAAFSMSVGEVSEPVKSSFGYHLIKLTAVQEASGKSYDQVRDQIKTAYLKNEAEKLFYEYAERLSDLTYEDPDSLRPAADALGIEVKTSDWIERSGASGLFASSKVTGAAFSDDVLLERRNSEAIELGPEHILVLRVNEHEESSLRPLEEVRTEIIDKLKSKSAAELASTKGKEMLEALTKGENMDSLANGAGLQVIDVDGVARNDTTLPPELVTSLFRLPRPVDGASSYGEAQLSNGNFVVLALKGVVDGDDKDAERIGGTAALKNALQRSRGQSYYQHLIENLKARADIVISKRE